MVVYLLKDIVLKYERCQKDLPLHETQHPLQIALLKSEKVDTRLTISNIVGVLPKVYGTPVNFQSDDVMYTGRSPAPGIFINL